MRRSLATALLLFAFTGCGAGEEARPAAAKTTDAAEGTLEVWLAREGALFLAERGTANQTAIGGEAVEALLAGPSPAEEAAGIGTAIPEGSELLGLEIDDGVATADMSEEFASGAGSSVELLRLAQLVYTLTQSESVDRVSLLIEGELGEGFASQGISTEDLRRGGFRGQLPAILVASPNVGESVRGPIEVSGSAKVFEANVSLALLAPDGTEIASGFTTASCGSGCRGRFATRLAAPADYRGPATLQVFESSANDGSKLNVVEIPLEVAP